MYLLWNLRPAWAENKYFAPAQCRPLVRRYTLPTFSNKHIFLQLFGFFLANIYVKLLGYVILYLRISFYKEWKGDQYFIIEYFLCFFFANFAFTILYNHSNLN